MMSCTREQSEAELHAKRQRFSSDATQAEVLHKNDILQQVLEYVGPDEYIFSAGINRKCRQMQTILSYKAAAANGRTKNKLRTSFAACISSSERLSWAFDCGLKHKAHRKPVQLAEAVLTTSADPAKVLALLNVQNFKAKDAAEGVKLCAAAAQRGDLQLLKWLRAHNCAWDAETCSEAARKDRLNLLIWAHENGCPWDEWTCSRAAKGGHLHILQWLREQGCPWNTHTCARAAYYRHLHVLQWAHTNGCPWDLSKVQLGAATSGSIRVLEWLQQNSGQQWTATEMTRMLDQAGLFDRKLRVAKWLRKQGAQWPSSFYSYDKEQKSMVSWSVDSVRWAVAKGCTWGDWSCQKLALKLYKPKQRSDAEKLFAWAHKHGCPCTCNSGSAAAAAAGAADETN
jgi:hypothetical protein